MNIDQVETVKRRPGRPATKKWDGASAKGKRTTKAVRDDSIHAARVQDERAAVDVHDYEDEPWVNPASLPYIKPRPGMVQRYIRVAMRGEADPVNTARKLREGWVPRRVDTVPRNVPVPHIDSGKYAGYVGVEGMILMEMPEERNAARNKYFANRNKQQSDAVDLKLAKETRGKVNVEKSTKVVREVAVAADE